MSIYTARQVVVICDACGFVEGEDFMTQREAIGRKRQEGWSIGRSVKCPKCRDEANKPYIPEEDFRHQFSH